MKCRVLFVCLGNICRSPAAEGVFRHLVKMKKLEQMFLVDSAGTSGFHVGERADARMRKHAEKRGYDLTSRSRQVCSQDFDNFDYILGMDCSNMSDLKSLAPRQVENLYLFTDFSSQFQGQDVPDPYYGGEQGFERVLDMVEDSSLGLIESALKRQQK